MHRTTKPIRFGRVEEDEGVRQRKKYEETLKQKKDLLKQEFDHLQEIRKYDEVSVQSLNEVKFKNELDKISNIRRQKATQLNNLNKNLEAIQLKNRKAEEGQSSNFMMSSSQGLRSVVNNHHSDPLYQTFSKNLLARNPVDLKEYIIELDSEDQRYQQLVETEHGKTDALKIDQEEIFKSKLKFQQEIEEFKLLNKVATNRFGNIEALNFLSVEKNTISKKNLKTIKSELKEMQEMRIEYRKTQQEKQRECKKEIYVGEEYVSHNGMKIEEAIQKHAELEKDIIILEQDERKILEKRQKSHNILHYIAAFEMFEQIFMNLIPLEKVQGINGQPPRLVDKYEVLEDLLKEQMVVIEQDLHENQMNFSTTEEEMLADFDRNELINVINNFFTIHPQGVAFILKFMLIKFWQLKTELLQNNQTYETQLREKTKLVSQFEILEYDYQDLLDKNAYIQEDEEDQKNTFKDKRKELLAEVAQIENVVDPKGEVAYDAGLFVSHIKRGENQEESVTTTINIFKLEMDEMTKIETMSSKNLKCQNLLFNFFLSFSELLSRQADTLQIVSANSYNMASVDLDQHVLTIVNFVKQIWQKQQPQKTRDPKVKKQVVQKNFQAVNQNLIQVPEQEVQLPHQTDQLNEHQIQVLFKEVFLGQSPNNESANRKSSQIVSDNLNNQLEKIIVEASHYFFVECKQDQLMWLLLSPQILRKFLLTLKTANQDYLKQKNIHKLQNNILLPSYQFSILKKDLVQIFTHNFETLLLHYQVLDIKLKDLSSELKIYLKEKDPKFDVQKLEHVQLREGGVIKDSREAISRKIDFYRSGEIKKKSKTDGPTISKIFHSKKVSNGDENDHESKQDILLKGLVKMVQPELHAQQEMFLLEQNQMNDDQLQQIKTFFRGKLQHKYEPMIQANKKAQDELKKQQNQKSTISEKDEFEEERDQIKGQIYTEWNTIQEQTAQKNLLPQEMEHLNEKKAQIKEVTQRLYGERGDTAQTLKTMSMTTGILSDIDRLEKQPSPIEQPFLISNYRLQKKTMHRNLNKEISLPTLHFLKPTSAYFARRQQSQEQLRAMAQKKYDLIESGMAPASGMLTLVRPNTDTNQRKMKTSQQERKSQAQYLQKQQTANVEKFYIRYGSQESSQQFLGYLMNKQGVDPQENVKQQGQMTLQEFPFQFNNKKESPQTDIYRSSGGGARPKSILVYPQQ